MISKEQLKKIVSLQQKKFRDAEGLFLAEGLKVVREALGSPYMVSTVIVSHAFTETSEFTKLTKKFPGLPAEVVSSKEMEKISTQSSPEGILALIQLPGVPQLKLNDTHILYLDEINDPGNMGTLLRSALWFGFNTVITSPGCVDLFNPKTVRASMGSLFRLNCLQHIPDHLLTGMLKPEYSIYAADMKGTDYRTVTYPAKVCLAIGNEHHGLRKEFLGLTDTVLTIPGSGSMESLNAAVAGSVLMAHLTAAAV